MCKHSAQFRIVINDSLEASNLIMVSSMYRFSSSTKGKKTFYIQWMIYIKYNKYDYLSIKIYTFISRLLNILFFTFLEEVFFFWLRLCNTECYDTSEKFITLLFVSYFIFNAEITLRTVSSIRKY